MAFDSSYESSVLEEMPSVKNPFLMLLDVVQVDQFRPVFGHGQFYSIIAVLSIGLLMLTAVLVMNIQVAIKTKRPFRLHRAVRRPEGTYYIAENSNLIPAAILLYWTFLMINVILDILVIQGRVSNKHMSLWSHIPFSILLLKTVFFAFSMLVSGIVTWSEVMRQEAPAKFLPICINVLQLVFIIVPIIIIGVLLFIENRAVQRSEDIRAELVSLLLYASKSWSPDSSPDPVILEYAVALFTKFSSSLNDIYDTISHFWLSWNIACAVPVVIICVSAGIILRGIRTHMKRMESVTALPTSLKMDETIVYPVGDTPKITLQQLRDKEKSLRIKMIALITPTVLWTLTLSLFLIYFNNHKPNPGNNGVRSIYTALDLATYWLALFSGGVIIISCFMTSLKEYHAEFPLFYRFCLRRHKLWTYYKESSVNRSESSTNVIIHVKLHEVSTKDHNIKSNSISN